MNARRKCSRVGRRLLFMGACALVAQGVASYVLGLIVGGAP